MGLFGDIFGLGGDAIGAGMSLQVAREQMDFQERMSNTAHQREAKDLQAAGLNRMLSVMGGPGASTPQGAMARVPDFGKSTRAIASPEATLNREKAKTEREKQTSERDIRFHRGFVNANLVAQTDQHLATRKMIDSQAFHQKMMNFGAKIEGDIDQSWAGIAARYGNRGLPFVNTALGAGALKKFMGTPKTTTPTTKYKNPFNQRTRPDRRSGANRGRINRK